MNFEFVNIDKRLIIVSLALSIAVVLSIPLIWIGIIALVFLSSFTILDEKYFLPISIVVFLVMTSDFTESYRNYLNILLILLLLFLYFKNFELQLNSFLSLPKEINYLVSLTIISMIVSSLFSAQILSTLIVTLRQIVFFVIVFIFYSFLADKKTVFQYLNSLVIVSVILGLVIFYDIISKGLTLFSIQSHSFTQFSGLYSNPNAVGLLLAVSIPVMIGLVLIKRRSLGRIKYFYYFALAFLIVVLFLTDSRASIGAVFISSVFILWRLKPKYLKFLLLSMAAIALFIIVSPVLDKYFGFYFRVERIFENTRYDIWAMSFQIIKHNFLFGVGPDLFATKIYKYLPVMLGTFEEHQIWWARSGTAHNFFLFKFTEMGVLGIISAMYLFFAFFKISFKVEKEIKRVDRDFYYISIVASSIGAGLLGRSFLESTGLLTNGWITRDLPFWIVFIIIIYLYQNIICGSQPGFKKEN